MSQRIKFCVLFSLACFLAVFTVSAQKQLQDNYFLEKTWTNNYALTASTFNTFGIVVDSSNRVYVADGNRVNIYDLNGNTLQTWAVASARDVALYRASNLVYVSTTTVSNQIKVYDLNGNFIRQWGGSGTNNGQFSSSSTLNTIAISASGTVYVVDEGNSRVQVFDLNGTYLSQFGGNGTLGGQFTTPKGITVGFDGVISVADWGTRRIEQFGPDGSFLRQYTPNVNAICKIVTAAPDGVQFTSCYTADTRLFSPVGEFLTLFNFGTFAPNNQIHGAAFTPDGQRLIILADKEIRVFRRVYHTAGLKSPPPLPVPIVLNTAQRTGTQWIDIDFSVIDPSNATVQVGAVGFVDGRQDLLAAVPMKTFTNGTDIVSWTNVTTGVQHHLTWNALADWFTLYGNMKINILAKDNRNLLDFHLITLPTNATYASPLTISVSPYGHTDFLGVWTWLIATLNPAINLATGSVYAVGNVFGVTNNTLLAQTQISGGTNTVTTTDGLTFLCSMISSNNVSTAFSNQIVRIATSNEVARAAMGTTHTNLATITKWPPVVQINGFPINLNEYGFDTGSITAGGGQPNNAWWVVLALPGQ